METDSGKMNEIRFSDFTSLSHRILNFARQGSHKLEFLREITRMLLEQSHCDSIEIWLKDDSLRFRWSMGMNPDEIFNFEYMDSEYNSVHDVLGCFCGEKEFILRCYSLICESADYPESENLSGKIYIPTVLKNAENIGSISPSLLLPFDVSEKIKGLLVIKCSNDRIMKNGTMVEFYDGIAKTLGIAIANRRAQAALKERIKELKCTYGICQIFNIPGLSLKSILRRIANLLPPAMQYPEISSGRIVLDGKSYKSSGFQGDGMKLGSDIIVDDEKRGFIEVIYGAGDPDLRPIRFLNEEQHLLDTIAGNVSLIIERKEAEQEKAKLTKQLRHADRLATLGQLAAGVAHEINEPLANILGFAQLGKKTEGIPIQLERDLGKIVSSCLHAREIVKKLLIFARQAPTRKDDIDMNYLVEDVISFFDSRFNKQGIRVHFLPDTALPQIKADPSQMRQVITNLVVNAMQSMPDGGNLTITTMGIKNRISMIIEDTGEGMSKKVLKQIFVPFFTTKEVGHGTGLGLPVVHGIITSHGGSINVESNPDKGSRFEVILPVTDTYRKARFLNELN